MPTLNTSQYLSNLLLGRLLPVPSWSSLNCVLPLNLKVEPRLKRLFVDGRLTRSVLTVLHEKRGEVLLSKGHTTVSLAEDHSPSFPGHKHQHIHPAASHVPIVLSKECIPVPTNTNLVVTQTFRALRHTH